MRIHGTNCVAAPVSPDAPLTIASTPIAQNATAMTRRGGAGSDPGIAGTQRRPAHKAIAAAIAAAPYASQVSNANPAGSLGSALGSRTTRIVNKAGASALPAPYAA